jgi:hypothetical protein
MPLPPSRPTPLQRFAMRQATIVREPDCVRRQGLAYFCDLDAETDPDVLSRRARTDPALIARRQAVLALRPQLKAYALARAAHAAHGAPLPPLPQDQATKAQVLAIADLLAGIAARHFGQEPVFDLARFRAAFDAFARGALHTGPTACDGAPDSAHYASFAVLAEWATVIPHAGQPHWRAVLHVFVATAAQYFTAYRAPAAAFSLYELRRPSRCAPLGPDQWAAWGAMDRASLLAALGDMLAVAFARNLETQNI